MKHLRFILPVLFVFCSAQSGENARAVLVEYKDKIVEAARGFGISPRLLASCIYAEQALNVKPGENILDVVFAKSGYNASVGIAQIKVQTAKWIERQLQDELGPVYLPDRLQALSGNAAKQEAIVDRLANPATNLRYAAAYVAMILKAWGPLFKELHSDEAIVSLVATLYSLGLTRPDGSLRLPHPNAHPNTFGIVASEFYGSFELRGSLAE